MKRVCILTDSRAEYGHLYWLMKEIESDAEMELRILVTGSHLMTEYGLTYKFIEADGFQISEKVPVTLKTDGPIGICENIGDLMYPLAQALSRIQPTVAVILGDRYEMMAAALACHILKIPIAHIHGGEVTEGAMDEAFRHAITKMAMLHFVSNETHRSRVLQLGEQPEMVFNYGAPGLDHCYRSKLLTREELSKSLDFDLRGPVAIVTYHPVTLGVVSSEQQIEILLRALEKSPLRVIFTRANADTDNRVINQKIAEFCRCAPQRFKFFDSLGQIWYLSALKEFEMMLGNSSSGVIESSSFGIPTVNVGERQQGRTRGLNVIDCACDENEILKSIQTALSNEFVKTAKDTPNPYGGPAPGKTSIRIKDQLKTFDFKSRLLQKKFYDIKV